MVTLPEISSYSKAEIDSLSAYSPIYAHYCKQIDRKPNNISDQIRIQKHEHWLKCALASHNGQHTTEQICLYWTEQTEKIISKAWQHCGLNSFDVSLLAFGKLGSKELNLSSDIDIVFVRDNSVEASQVHPPLKKFIQLLSENTSFGFAYRIDIDLRPGGDLSPLAPNKTNFYNYFDEYLEAWNRLSFIRMRPLLGPKKLNNDLLSYSQRASFPRRLDFSVINEIKSIRSKINFQWRKANEPLDIKFHPGGIRDIEFYIQSLQVIYGGRHTNLKVSSITAALNGLMKVEALKKEDREFLHSFYWELRHLENLIHIKEDKHTYLLPANFFQELTHLTISEKSLIEHLKQASNIIGDFFIENNSAHKAAGYDLGSFDESSAKAIRDIENLKSHSLKKHSIELLKNEILATFISETEKIAIDQNLAIQTFRDFIFAIKSKSSIFHLLHRHHELLENLAWLFSISPYAGQLICRRPELIDSFVLGRVLVDPKEDLETFLENLGDYKLLGQLVAIIYLFKNNNIKTYCRQLSTQADFISQQLMSFIQKELGSDPVDILCMGKWSGFELGIQSDLDFVFLTEKQPNQKQIKLARRMINLMTNQSKAGKLYDIDLRLKPNENAGPLILEKPKFFDFIKNEAEQWQKQAYLRSRLLGDEHFFFKDQFDLLRIDASEVKSLEDIHAKLLSHSSEQLIDLKASYGGIIHTEFTIQKKCLLQPQPPKSSATEDILQTLSIDQDLSSKIFQNYQFLRQFEQTFQICNDSSSTKVSINNQNISRVSKMLNCEDAFQRLQEVITEQQHLLKSLDLNH